MLWTVTLFRRVAAAFAMVALPVLVYAQAPAGADVVPVYRYHSDALADHLYTTDPNELGCSPLSLYQYEGFDGMVMRRQETGTTALHRFYLERPDNLAGHFYTTNPASAPAGYEYVDTIGYVFSTQVAGTVALRSWTARNGTAIIDHFLTTHDFEPLPEVRPQYSDDGAIGYVFPYPANGPLCGAYSYQSLSFEYHLHKEPASDGNLSLMQSAPDAPATIETRVVTDALVGLDSPVKSYSLPTGTPNLGTIQSGTRFMFSVWLRKTTLRGVLLPWGAVVLTSPSATTTVCGARGGLELTRSFVRHTFDCVADTSVPMAPDARLTMRAGFYTQGGPGTGALSVELGTEGALDGNYDSTLEFMIVPSPYVTSLEPPRGFVGDAVLIKGSRFGDSQDDGSVEISGVTAAIASWSDTLIAAVVPVGATTGPLIVNANGMSSNAVLFELSVLGDPGGSPSFYHTDVIGSVRMTTDLAGAVVARYDYLPFGQEFPGPNADSNSIFFAGKERERQTGVEGLGWSPLDYFGARYYQGQTGRFTSVDPVTTLHENLLDPQRWNKYVYARNNPFRYVDPDGRSATATLGAVGFIAGGLSALATGQSGREALAAAVEGAVSGALLGSVVDTGGGSALVMWGAGAVAGIAGRLAGDAVRGETTTVTEGAYILVMTPFGVRKTPVATDKLGRIVNYGGTIQSSARKWTLGSGKSATKWANQMAKRGWNEKQIDEALTTKGIATRNAVNPGNPAMRHVHPETGQSIAIDTKTNEIIHIGGKNFDYSHWDLP
jgi:RHS repeat-associated protein